MGTVRASGAVGLAEAKDRLSALTAEANRTGVPFTILKNNKPWVEVRPLASASAGQGAISITPSRRVVDVPDLEALFEGYDGSYRPSEDGFASPAGREAL